MRREGRVGIFVRVRRARGRHMSLIHMVGERTVRPTSEEEEHGDGVGGSDGV